MMRNSPVDRAKYSPARTVLVVDDEALIRWSLGETLKQAGFEVIDAADGRSAIRWVTETAPHAVDAVLLDLKLPDIDGLALIDHIRRVRPGCPIILMTAYGTPETLQDALRRGAAETVTKPFNVDDVVDLVQRVLAAPPA